MAWVIWATMAAYCVSKLFWYSCSEDGGDLSFEMTHASKKLPLDSHSESSLVSLARCSSVAVAGG